MKDAAALMRNQAKKVNKMWAQKTKLQLKDEVEIGTFTNARRLISCPCSAIKRTSDKKR